MIKRTLNSVKPRCTVVQNKTLWLFMATAAGASCCVTSHSFDVTVQDVRKQRATGRTREGHSFPLSIKISRAVPADAHSELYVGVVWVFANISGMITILPDGTIHGINNNFALMLFGYTAETLEGKVCLSDSESRPLSKKVCSLKPQLHLQCTYT